MESLMDPIHLSGWLWAGFSHNTTFPRTGQRSVVDGLVGHSLHEGGNLLKKLNVSGVTLAKPDTRHDRILIGIPQSDTQV